MRMKGLRSTMVRLPSQLDWDEFYALFVLRRLPPRGNRTTIQSSVQFLVDDLTELQKAFPGWRYNRDEAHLTCEAWIRELAADGFVTIDDPNPHPRGAATQILDCFVEVSEKGAAYLVEVPKNDPDICELYDKIPWSPKRLLDALAQEG